MRDRLIAYLPRYAPHAARLRWLMNLRNRIPALATLSEKLLGFSAKRSLPEWKKPWRDPAPISTPQDVKGDGLDLVLFADTFNRYFEPCNLDAATRVLNAAGYRLHHVRPKSGTRPLDCGRTFLSLGQVDQARVEARRLCETLLPFVTRGCRIVGLEPSSLLTLRDEYQVLLPKVLAGPIGKAAFLVEGVLAADLKSGRVTLPLKDHAGRIAHLHGHCHQKAAGAMGAVEACLRAVPGLEVKLIDSSCCGMAGSFGYQAETHEISLAMGELSLLPAVRQAKLQDFIVADGTSCRHQIADGAGCAAIHVVRLLDSALG